MKYFIATFVFLSLTACQKPPTQLAPQVRQASQVSPELAAKRQHCLRSRDILLQGGVKKGMTEDQVRAVMGDPHRVSGSYWSWAGEISGAAPLVRFSSSAGKGVAGVQSGATHHCNFII